MKLDRAELIEALLPKAQGKPRALLHVAELLRAERQEARAVELCDQALALAPGDREFAIRAHVFLAAGVPTWHFDIVRDAARNEAYEAALRRAIKPGSRVLDIGTGTGILAMMAARAGAAEVFACEMNPMVARAAAEIVAANGLADRIRVIPKHSNALDADADLGGRVDIVVSEIVTNDILGEEVLDAHERAVRDLLVPGGQVIPAFGIARVALAEEPALDQERLGTISGFDLSIFNRLRAPSIPTGVGTGTLALRSDPADLFAFDLGTDQYCKPARSTIELRSHGGRVNSVVQWMVLGMDQAGTYEAAPRAMERSAWALVLHPLPEPLDTEPGQAVRVTGAHDRFQLTIWAD